MDDEKKDKLSICDKLYGWYYAEFFKKTKLLRFIRNIFMFITLSTVAALIFLLTMSVNSIYCCIGVILLSLVAWIVVEFSIKRSTDEGRERIQKLKSKIEQPEYFGQCGGLELNRLLTYVEVNEDSKVVEIFTKEDAVNYIVVTVISTMIGEFIDDSSQANQMTVTFLVWLLFVIILGVRIIKVDDNDMALMEFKNDIRKLLINNT